MKISSPNISRRNWKNSGQRLISEDLKLKSSLDIIRRQTRIIYLALIIPNFWLCACSPCAVQ
ncbi:hypothetical protein CPC08DRAFT_23372 [Agrocybe pediades]|nr:hypothetical protein CPC08DRAFT_23372 [Agrocybe pediades]